MSSCGDNWGLMGHYTLQCITGPVLCTLPSCNNGSASKQRRTHDYYLLASHLAELDVDITLGCNYIINWRYREQTVVQHQSSQAIFRLLGHCLL